MKKWSLTFLLLSCVLGCVEPPVPTGPAAEAPTDEIEITMDQTPTDGGSNSVQE